VSKVCNNCGCNADPFAFNAEKKNCGCGQDPCVTYGAESLEDLDKSQLIDLIKNLEDRDEYVKGYVENAAESFNVYEGEDWEYHVYVSDSPTDDIFIVHNARDFGTQEEAIKAAHEVSNDKRGKGKMVYVVAEEREMDMAEVIYSIYEDGEVYGAESFSAESGQMCGVCFGNDDLPYDSDHFTDCRRCGKSVCIDCDGEMEYHPDWFKVCGECDNILENVSIHGAESFGAEWVYEDDGWHEDMTDAELKQMFDEQMDAMKQYQLVPCRTCGSKEIGPEHPSEGSLISCDHCGAEYNLSGELTMDVRLDDGAPNTFSPDFFNWLGYWKSIEQKGFEGNNANIENREYVMSKFPKYLNEMHKSLYAESFGADESNLTVKYWIYRGLRGGGFNSRLNGVIFDTREEAEKYVKEQDSLLPNAEHTIIEKHYKKKGKLNAESLMAINQNTPISNFSTNELTHSSTVQGDFNQASINSSGHQNFEVRGAEEEYYRVRCNKCMWEGEEEDLVMFEDEDGFGKGCPKCETDAYLMDVEEYEAESFVLKTDSGHEVEWDDGSFYMTFKEPIDGYGVVSGDWYGGEKESPDEISLDVEPAWDEENDDDYDVPSLYIQFDNVEYYGIKNHNMTVSDDIVVSPELSGAIQEGLARMVADHADKTVVSREYKGESFGAEYGKRQRFGNRYVGRDTKGKFISNVSVGRSLKADRRTKSKTPARSGFGHKGDTQKGASGGFKMPTDAKSLIGIGAVLGGLLAYWESKA
jgi:hypothetical protein